MDMGAYLKPLHWLATEIDRSMHIRTDTTILTFLLDCLFNSLFMLQKQQSHALLDLPEGNHWWLVDSPHKGTVMLNLFIYGSSNLVKIGSGNDLLPIACCTKPLPAPVMINHHWIMQCCSKQLNTQNVDSKYSVCWCNFKMKVGKFYFWNCVF